MRTPFTGLWRHPDFLKLWVGQTISLFGDEMTLLALPLVAVITLHVSVVQMGVLGAMETAPVLLLGLIVGVWVDRLPRRTLLIIADLGRAVLLLLIPIAARFGILNIVVLWMWFSPIRTLGSQLDPELANVTSGAK